MNSKEIVERAIAFQEVPRVPVSLLDGHAWIGVQNGLSPEEMGMMDDERAVDMLLGAYDKVGSDLVFTSAGHYMALHDVIVAACGGVDPAAPGADMIDDVLALDPAHLNEALDGHPAIASQRRRIELMHERVGNEKLIMAFSTAPLTTASMLIGMEGLMEAIVEDPEVVEQVVSLGMELSAHIVDDQMAHGATAITMADPVSSSAVISEDTFLSLSFPALKKACAGWRRHECPVLLHICGDSTARLRDLCGLDIDIFSLDGGDLAEELAIARRHYAVFGNLSTVDVMMNATPDEVAARAAALRETAGLGGGYILAPGCDLPPATPRENVLALTA